MEPCEKRPINRKTLTGYGGAVLAIALTTALAWPLREMTNAVNLAMFFLIGVVFIAAKFGTGPSVLASLLGVSAFSVFFTKPYYSLHADDPEYYFTFIAMLTTSLVIGSLASRLRMQASIAREAQQHRIEAETERLRNVLLSSVSHDLRTPLASISGISSSLLLSGMALPEAAEEGLRSIRDQSDKLAKIVANLLDVSSLESGKVALNTQPYFLEEVIGAALLRLEGILEDREVETIIDSDRLIDMDGLLIEQVFSNLIENAAKYADKDAHIRIVVTENDAVLEIAVSDDGPGIPMDDLPHVFEKFYHSPQGGTGLGLAICKAIVATHGGRIWAANNASGGACLTFTLPITPNEKMQAA